MSLAPSVAVVVLLMVAVIVVALTKVMPLIVTPAAVPAGMLTVDVVVKLVPVKVTFTDVPRSSEAGAMDVSVGATAAVTVNVTGPSVAAPTVTVTFLAVADAPDEMVKVAVTVVALAATKLLTVMPPPDTLTAVAPVRPVPVMVTFTTEP